MTINVSFTYFFFFFVQKLDQKDFCLCSPSCIISIHLKEKFKVSRNTTKFLKVFSETENVFLNNRKNIYLQKKTKVQRERNRNKNKCLLFISFLLFLRFSFYKNLVDKYFLLSMFKVSFSCHDILFLYDPWPIIEFLYKQYMHMMP